MQSFGAFRIANESYLLSLMIVSVHFSVSQKRSPLREILQDWVEIQRSVRQGEIGRELKRIKGISEKVLTQR